MLGLEDPLEEGRATHSSILAWRIPMDRGAWQAIVHGVTKSQTRLSNFHFHSINDSSLSFLFLYNNYMAESEEELKSLLMKVKEESEKAGLKLQKHHRW